MNENDNHIDEKRAEKTIEEIKIQLSVFVIEIIILSDIYFWSLLILESDPWKRRKLQEFCIVESGIFFFIYDKAWDEDYKLDV